MSKFTLIVFVFLFTTRVVNGAPFITTNQTTTNSLETPNTKPYDASVCPDNCTFVFSADSVITAQKTLEKFLHKRKSMLIYITLYTKNLTLLPADQKKQNQIREWQWTLTENLWYVNLPIDLDYASFHITYYGESRIRLDLEAMDSTCCTIGDGAVNKVRDRLWFDVFSNKSGSLLCNRYFDNQDWKTSFFAITTVWIGYDLLCVAPDVDKNYSEKSDTTATILIPLFCFFIALYYPLLNKIIENANIRNHLEHVKSESGMKLTDYKQEDSPFGYRRIMLKYFFPTNLISSADNQEHFMKKLKFVPLFRLTILYFLVYLFMTIVPMVLEYKFDEEELTDFDTIYKLGLPVFHFDFLTQMCLTCLVYLPLTVAAKAYATYCFSEHSDFLIFINLGEKCGKNVDDIIKEIKNADNKDREDRKVTENANPEDGQLKNDKIDTKTRAFTNQHNKETSNIKTDQTAVQNNNDKPNEQTNQEANKQTFISEVLKFKFYSKFIMRFNLLLSKTFWEYIWGKSGSDRLWHFDRFLIFIINVLLIVPMCAFPTIWFMFFPVFNRIRGWIPSKKTKSGDPEPTPLEKTKEPESGSTRQRDPEDMKETKLGNTEETVTASTRKKLKTFLIHAVLISLELICIFLLYLDMSMIIFVERSVMYIVFIAITNYDHLLRIVIVVFTCAGYLGLFITAFVEKYAIVLKIMFEQKESTETQDASKDSNEVPTAYPNETETVKSKDASAATKDSKNQRFISEKQFDYVIDHLYALREHFFFVILKIVITVMFFMVSLVILLQSNVFDSTTKLTNIIEFMIIIVTPTLVLKCFEKDKGSPMKDHEQDIKDNTISLKNNDSDSNNDINCCSKCFGLWCCWARCQFKNKTRDSEGGSNRGQLNTDGQKTPQEPAVDNRILNSNETRHNHEDTPLHNDRTHRYYRSTSMEDNYSVQESDDREKLLDSDNE